MQTERFDGTHSLFESREVGVDGAGAEVVDKRQVFPDVSHRPAAEEAVQQALVPSWRPQTHDSEHLWKHRSKRHPPSYSSRSCVYVVPIKQGSQIILLGFVPVILLQSCFQQSVNKKQTECVLASCFY